MLNINEKLYGDLSEAVAFVIRFNPMVYTYGDIDMDDFETLLCSKCRHRIRDKVFLAPKASCKKEYAILHNLEYGVSEKIKEELIAEFDITEDDFRKICTKRGEIVYWQITPQHIMKPIYEFNRGRKLKPCSKCGFIQYRLKEYEHEPAIPYYYITKEVLEDMHDINRTYETFMRFYPKYFVSRRVYDYLIEKYPRMMFAPVFLKEEGAK